MPTPSPSPRPTHEPSAAPTTAVTRCDKLQADCNQGATCLLEDAPVLSSASFSTTGAQLHVFFDIPTDQGGRDIDEHFVCSEVLTFPDAGATTCYFATASQIVADASAAPGLEEDTNVVLPYGKLRRACDWERCECDLPNPGAKNRPPSRRTFKNRWRNFRARRRPRPSPAMGWKSPRRCRRVA